LKDKLIGFPTEILDVLDDYKKRTGIPATDYIRKAVVKQMIIEGLIFIHMKYITVEAEKENSNKVSVSDAIEANKFCDDDKCELPVILEKC